MRVGKNCILPDTEVYGIGFEFLSSISWMAVFLCKHLSCQKGEDSRIKGGVPNTCQSRIYRTYAQNRLQEIC